MNQERRRELLHLARFAMMDELRDRTHSNRPQPQTGDAPQEDFHGVFVTLRDGKRLRGCMGTFRPEGTLAQTVDRVARLACRDPRFVGQPVTAAELPTLNIEISVLGPLQQTREPLSLTLGTHGILIRRGEASGCFLPHVATEAGWGVEEFLGKCCATKAGLREDAWKDPETAVYLFTADVFGENDTLP